MAEDKKTKTVPGLRVVAKKEGFRRAGVAWTVAPTDVEVGKFNNQQIAVLRADPQLVVTDIQLPVASD